MMKAVERLLPQARPANLMGTLARAPKTFDICGKRFDVTESASDFLAKPVRLTPANDQISFFSAEFERDPELFCSSSPIYAISAAVRYLDGEVNMLPAGSGDSPTKYADIPPRGQADALLHRAHLRATSWFSMSNTHIDVWSSKDSAPIPANWACVWDGKPQRGGWPRAVINFANVFMVGREPFVIDEERKISLDVHAYLQDAATHPHSVDLMLHLPGETHSLNGMITKLKPESLRVGDVFYASTDGDRGLQFWSDMFPRLFGISPYDAAEGYHAVSIPEPSSDGSFLSVRQSVVIGRSFFEPEKTGYLWTLE